MKLASRSVLASYSPSEEEKQAFDEVVKYKDDYGQVPAYRIPTGWVEMKGRLAAHCPLVLRVRGNWNGYSYDKVFYVPPSYVGHTETTKDKRVTQRFKRQQKRTRERREIADRLGVLPNSRTLDLYMSGDIDEDEAKRIGEITRRRHEDTNYDDLLRSGYDKDTARAMMEKTSSGDMEIEPEGPYIKTVAAMLEKAGFHHAEIREGNSYFNRPFYTNGQVAIGLMNSGGNLYHGRGAKMTGWIARPLPPDVREALQSPTLAMDAMHTISDFDSQLRSLDASEVSYKGNGIAGPRDVRYTETDHSGSTYAGLKKFVASGAKVAGLSSRLFKMADESKPWEGVVGSGDLRYHPTPGNTKKSKNEYFSNTTLGKVVAQAHRRADKYNSDVYIHFSPHLEWDTDPDTGEDNFDEAEQKIVKALEGTGWHSGKELTITIRPSSKNSERVEGRLGAEDKTSSELPQFANMQEVKEWIDRKSKAYGGKDRFLSSPEYREAYPTLKKIHDSEKDQRAETAGQVMKEQGVAAGDRVEYVYVSQFFGFVEHYTGVIQMRKGIPYVKLDKKDERGRSLVRWNKGWKKISGKTSSDSSSMRRRVLEIDPSLASSDMLDELVDGLCLLDNPSQEELEHFIEADLDRLEEEREEQDKADMEEREYAEMRKESEAWMDRNQQALLNMLGDLPVAVSVHGKGDYSRYISIETEDMDSLTIRVSDHSDPDNRGGGDHESPDLSIHPGGMTPEQVVAIVGKWVRGSITDKDIQEAAIVRRRADAYWDGDRYQRAAERLLGEKGNT